MKATKKPPFNVNKFLAATVDGGRRVNLHVAVVLDEAEYVHNSCTILTFATAFRPAFLKMTPEAWQAEINKTPLKRRAEYKRSVIEHGLDSEFVAEALAHHRKLLSWMADSLKSSPYLAGESFSHADCAVIPYILRLELLKLGGMWDHNPSIAELWARAYARCRNISSIVSSFVLSHRQTAE